MAVGIIAELGDLRRFGSSKQFAGYVRLAAGNYKSGTNLKSIRMNPDPVMQAYYRRYLDEMSGRFLSITYNLLSRTF